MISFHLRYSQILEMIGKHFYFFIFFNVRLLSVLGDHSVFSSPPQRPMTSDFEGFSISYFIYDIYFPILILEKEPVFPFWMFSAKQENYWYHFYNVFGTMRFLTGDWNRDLRTRSQHSTTRLSRRRLIILVFISFLIDLQNISRDKHEHHNLVWTDTYTL